MGHQEGAAQVNADHAVPSGNRQILHRLAVSDPGIVDENVDPPGSLQRLGNKLFDLRLTGNIGLHRQRLRAQLADVFRHGLCRRRLIRRGIVHDHAGSTGTGNGHCHARADAR